MKLKYSKVRSMFVVMLLSFFITGLSLPVSNSHGSNPGPLERRLRPDRHQDDVDRELRQKKDMPEIEDQEPTPEAAEEPVSPEQKIYIAKIEVRGVSLLSEEDIKAITKNFESKEQSFSELRQVTDLINAEYRRRGYPTSTAYFIPQRIEDDTVIIEVAEGRVGEITLEGNRHFSDRLLLRYLDSMKGELLNYETLRSDLGDMNEHPDRRVRAVLTRGEQPGESDINLVVEERFPWHLTLGYNNHNPKHLERNKFMIELKNTNLLGMDDIASAEVQLGDAGLYQLYSGRYLFPFNADHKVGFSYIRLNQELGGRLGPLDITGKGDMYSLYYMWRLYNTDNVTFSVSPGFVYKDVRNEIFDGAITIKDNVRIAKLGLDLDVSDPFYGRTLITHEFDWGIPRIFGGLSANKSGSRAAAGSGGEFFKTVTNAARVQQLPWDLSSMVKGAFQLTGDNLLSTEQYTIGGPTTVRGYPVAEYSGDRGFWMSSELYVPPYMVPKDWKIPFTETTIYDSLRFVGFFDWGRVTNRNPRPGEISKETLYSIGPAIRFDIPDRLSVSFDYGFGLGQQGSDGNKTAGYIEVKLHI